MLFTISGKHITVTEAMRNHAQSKTEKLPRYYSSVDKVEVIIDGSEVGIKVEVIAHAKNGQVFVAVESDTDAYKCIDMAVHKLESQIKKRKTIERDNKQN